MANKEVLMLDVNDSKINISQVTARKPGYRPEVVGYQIAGELTFEEYHEALVTIDPDVTVEIADKERETETEGLLLHTWMGAWCLYDIPREHVMYCQEDYFPSEEEIKLNIIKMPVAQAHMIRRTKGLPMPAPPVRVQVHRDEYGSDLDAKVKDE